MELTKNQKLLQQAMIKANEDQEFRQRFVSDPLEMVQQLTGETLTLVDHKELIIVDRSDESRLYVELASFDTSFDDVELSEETLDQVAGGIDHGGCIPPHIK